MGCQYLATLTTDLLILNNRHVHALSDQSLLHLWASYDYASLNNDGLNVTAVGNMCCLHCACAASHVL